MKNIINVLTSIAITLTLLLGCGGDDSSPDTQDDIDNFVFGTGPPSAEPVSADMIGFSLNIANSEGVSTLNVTQDSLL